MKYADWLVQWLENYVRPSVRVRTYERYKLIAEQHIRDKIGGIALDDLSPLVLQRFVTELLPKRQQEDGGGAVGEQRQYRYFRIAGFSAHGARAGADGRVRRG